MMKTNAQASSTGFAMLEVLIAVVVLATGMMGIAGMLLLSHKSNSSSYIKQQSVQSAYDIFDRMRANRQAAVNGNYNVSNLVKSGTPTLPSAPATDCASTACTAAQLVAYDTWHWLAKDVAQLPNGSGAVSTAAAATGGNTLVTVTVQWDDSPAQKNLGALGAAPAASPNLAQFVIQTLL
ncbi:type IV pilus modification protein PilV [Paraherbaspirillum soli]|uniref:Type IV pilus modification protein PilV n=1 Tax=Paraherbaspirillum soli TaxID=631222 RepID=A0ABW0M9X3_9BURK